MKTLLFTVLITGALGANAQSIVGKWQLSESKTCFQSEMKESETEKELSSAMSSSSNTGVARVMTLGEKGTGEEAVMSTGRKKGSSKESFRYQLSGSPDGQAGTEFQFLDKKSGLVTSRWVIDELTETSLKMHDAARDCEVKTYIKAK